MNNGSIVRCQEPSNNSLVSSSKNLWPIDEVVDKYYGLDDIEILPDANGSISLVPSGLLPWENGATRFLRNLSKIKPIGRISYK